MDYKPEMPAAANVKGGLYQRWLDSYGGKASRAAMAEKTEGALMNAFGAGFAAGQSFRVAEDFLFDFMRLYDKWRAEAEGVPASHCAVFLADVYRKCADDLAAMVFWKGTPKEGA